MLRNKTNRFIVQVLALILLMFSFAPLNAWQAGALGFLPALLSIAAFAFTAFYMLGLCNKVQRAEVRARRAKRMAAAVQPGYAVISITKPKFTPDRAA